MLSLPPLVILALSVVVVLGMILVFRLNAFLALITAALTVSLLAPEPSIQAQATNKEETAAEGVVPVARVQRVAEALGKTAGKIAIPIAMAAIIGGCLAASGAADRIVRATLSLFGAKHSAGALSTSGFLLAIPVFFDTVFFLLAPIAKSMYRSSGRNYLKCLLALGLGASVGHTLIPPTPGPLLVAEQLGVDIGWMMIFGVLVGVPMTVAGLLYAAWIDRRMPLENPPELTEVASSDASRPEPALGSSLAPILFPAILIAGHTLLKTVAKLSPSESLHGVLRITALFGEPSFALSLAAGMALWIYVRHIRPSRNEMASMVDNAISSAGVIILITAAGGAFGAMLKEAQVGTAIVSIFARDPSGGAIGGTAILMLAFGIASLLKISQGSTTVAMITSSAMMAALISEQPLPFDPVYIALGNRLWFDGRHVDERQRVLGLLPDGRPHRSRGVEIMVATFGRQRMHRNGDHAIVGLVDAYGCGVGGRKRNCSRNPKTRTTKNDTNPDRKERSSWKYCVAEALWTCLPKSLTTCRGRTPVKLLRMRLAR